MNGDKKTTRKNDRSPDLSINGVPFEDVLADLLKVKPAKESAGSKTPKKKSAKKTK